jgi:NAD(P)-dependent dehydrogenase (short-subunit alcohol dehydrogenase family)
VGSRPRLQAAHTLNDENKMSENLFELTGEVAVVIGATGVLGGALAKGLADAGASVAILGRSHERGEACVRRITDSGGKAKFFHTDATQHASLAAAHQEIEAALGAPTVLVNAAGGNDPKTTVTPDNPVENVATDAWRASFEMNLVGGILLPCQEFGPAMGRRGKGSIINIASVSGHIPLSRVMAYSSSKAAVLSLTQFLAREWATKNVRVNSITPGFFPAEQNRALLYNKDGSPTPRAQSILGHTPMARFGESKELIGAAIFLASPRASSFITGTDIRVDGGFLSQTI